MFEVLVKEDTRMKSHLIVGVSVVVLGIVAFAFSARTFRAAAQDPPVTTPSGYYLMPEPTQSQPPQPTASVDRSLPEMIADLKELRKQELQLTKKIKEKIQAQQKSLDDAEKELNSMFIDPPERLVPQPVPTPPATITPYGPSPDSVSPSYPPSYR
jgi:hypothetical protein